jgi:hypothetical protein
VIAFAVTTEEVFILVFLWWARSQDLCTKTTTPKTAFHIDMSCTVTKTNISEVLILEPKVFGDSRGLFLKASTKSLSWT